MGWNILTVVDSTDGSISGGTEITEWTSNRVSITHGRKGLADDVKPSTGSFEFLWNATGAPTANSFNIGRRIQVWLEIDSYPSNPQCLFDGSLTDVSVRNDTLNVIAVNRALAEAGRQTVTSASVIEDTVANALTTVYNLGPQTNRLGTTQGSKQVRVPAFSAENLLGLMREIADSENAGYVTNSMPWGPTVSGNTTGPVVLNRTQDDRAQISPDITFTGDELLDEWRFERHQDQLVNRVAVYGTEDATDFPDGSVSEDNQTSIDDYGLNELDIVTRLRYQNDAELLAANKLDRYFITGWVIERLQLLLGNMTDARLYDVLTNLNPDSYIRVPEIFSGAPIRFFVEGIQFKVSRHDLQASLFVSTGGYSRSSQKWSQVTPTLTWADVPATVTWIEARTLYL